jgi:hypothetical protein
MAQTVVAVFDSHTGAIHGVEELRRAGFQPSQISILAPDPREAEGYAEELGIRVIQAGSLGLAAGGILGGVAGWLAGLTGLLVPGAGIILAAGPFAGALVGAMGGASLGGFVGALIGLGLPAHAAEEFDRALREGQTLLVVHPSGNFIGAEVALNRAHPLGLHHYDEAIGAEVESELDLSPGLPRPPHAPTGRVELAAPDHTLSPAGNVAAVEGQQSMLHDQYLDEADLRPITGRADT